MSRQRNRFPAIVLSLLAASCSPAGFASHEADLMQSPPSTLPGASSAYWNDVSSGTYGAITVGPRSYRYQGVACRTARITAIATTGATQDRMLLYCARSDGRFTLDPTLSCRSTADDNIACRTASGDDLVLPPA